METLSKTSGGVLRFGQRAAVRAGLFAGGAIGGSLVVNGQAMDPTMSALVRLVRRLPPGRQGGPGPGGSEGGPGLAAIRRQYAAALELTGWRGDREVAVSPAVVPGAPRGRMYVPAGSLRGVLLYFHGGGFVMGSPATHDGLCRRLAVGTGVRVISAGYRLAPEHPFPAAHDDAATALDWVRGRWPGPLVIGGDSAGANLAASLAIDGSVAGQLLLYPVVDMMPAALAGPLSSLRVYGEGFLLTAAAMEACARALAPGDVDRSAGRLSPVRGDLSRAARAVVVVAGFDPLRDQGNAYAAALLAAGRPVELLTETGLVHGFADFAGVVPAARRAVDRVAVALRRMM